MPDPLGHAIDEMEVVGEPHEIERAQKILDERAAAENSHHSDVAPEVEPAARRCAVAAVEAGQHPLSASTTAAAALFTSLAGDRERGGGASPTFTPMVRRI